MTVRGKSRGDAEVVILKASTDAENVSRGHRVLAFKAKTGVTPRIRGIVRFSAGGPRFFFHSMGSI